MIHTYHWYDGVSRDCAIYYANHFIDMFSQFRPTQAKVLCESICTYRYDTVLEGTLVAKVQSHMKIEKNK